METYTIKSRWTGEAITSIEATSWRADLSNANLRRADLRRADLNGADLRRADLSGADLRRADLSGADLRRANLSNADLNGANLSDANLSNADLNGANLSDANLSNADLNGADLNGANLSDANLSDGITIPVIPNLDNEILAAVEAGGRLEMNTWHTCKTTHCRAGWAITLAGDEGAALEMKIGSCAAGALIYHASAGYVPNFCASNSEALEDIRAHAEQA